MWVSCETVILFQRSSVQVEVMWADIINWHLVVTLAEYRSILSDIQPIHWLTVGHDKCLLDISQMAIEYQQICWL